MFRNGTQTRRYRGQRIAPVGTAPTSRWSPAGTGETGAATYRAVNSDENLIRAVAAGSEDALRELYDRHAGTMLRLLHRLSADRATAEEIMQEAWLAVWQAAGSFRGDSSVRGWLLGVARRQAHNRLRRSTVATTELDEAAAVPDPTVDVEAQVLIKAD